MTSKRGLWLCFILQGVCLLGFALYGVFFDLYATKIKVPIRVDNSMSSFLLWRFDETAITGISRDQMEVLRAKLEGLYFSDSSYCDASFVNRPGAFYLRMWHERIVLDAIVVGDETIARDHIWWSR